MPRNLSHQSKQADLDKWRGQGVVGRQEARGLSSCYLGWGQIKSSPNWCSRIPRDGPQLTGEPA